MALPTDQKRAHESFWFAIALVLTSALLTACGSGKDDDQGPPHRIAEAYQLLDQSENAKATIVLNDQIRLDPENSDEARVLLASAYMGLAGVSIYSIWDNFHDILFDKPLSEVFLEGQKEREKEAQKDGGKKAPSLSEKNSDTDSESVGNGHGDGERDGDGESNDLGDRNDDVGGNHHGDGDSSHEKTKPPEPPIKKLLDRLDRFLTELRSTITFLNRFPTIPKQDWVLLTQAIQQLEHVPPRKDIMLYRVFIRLIHLRVYLDDTFLKNPDIGTRRWACALQVEKFKDDLRWIATQLQAGINEFNFVFPEKKMGLTKLSIVVDGLVEELGTAEKAVPVGTSTSILTVENYVRRGFGCDNLSSK